eukprot:358380-Chlamydomonas_euryale.AAC.2
MAGRAGRRGFDTQGHCVVLQNRCGLRFEGADEAYKIIRAGPEPLTSQFTASYGLVLNLLSVYTLAEARQFVKRSFGNFLQTEGTARRIAEADALEAKAKDILQQVGMEVWGRLDVLAADGAADSLLEGSVGHGALEAKAKDVLQQVVWKCGSVEAWRRKELQEQLPLG